MSHIETGKTRIVFPSDLRSFLQRKDQQALADHPCLKLLAQAVHLVAEEHTGEIHPYYYDFHYHQQSTNTGLALHIPLRPDQASRFALPRGLGLVIDQESGALHFRGDPWNVDPGFYQRMQDAIVQNYTALAHMAVLRQMNYQVTSQVEEGRILITGGMYAA